MRLVVVLFLAVSLAAAQQPEKASPSPAEKEKDAPQLQTRDEAAEQHSIVVPAGTKVLLELRNAVNTHSARVGDGIYCETTFPVTANNKMLIPAGTYVQGKVTSVKKPGRVKGRAELLVHFTTLIFPNGYTVELPGALEAVPGADNKTIKDQEGTMQADSQKGQDAAVIATSAGTGTLIGGLSHGMKGAGIGAGVGAGVGLATVLLTKGQDVRIDTGTPLEMVLQRSLTLDETKIGDTMQYVPRREVRRTLPPPQDKKPSRPVVSPYPGTVNTVPNDR